MVTICRVVWSSSFTISLMAYRGNDIHPHQLTDIHVHCCRLDKQCGVVLPRSVQMGRLCWEEEGNSKKLIKTGQWQLMTLAKAIHSIVNYWLQFHYQKRSPQKQSKNNTIYITSCQNHFSQKRTVAHKIQSNGSTWYAGWLCRRAYLTICFDTDENQFFCKNLYSQIFRKYNLL